MTDPAPANSIANPNPVSTGTSGHEESAPLNLSGRSVLAAWVMSVAAHIIVLLLVGNLVFPFSTDESENDLPVAEAQIVGSVHSTAFVPAPPPDLVRRPKRETAKSRPPTREFAKLSDLTTTTKPELSIIGIGAGGADFADFRVPMDLSASSEFFGVGRSARGVRRIVYVVDRSGSMIDSFRYVQAELKRSISALRRNQKFHVIFFNSGEPLENPPQRLVSAIEVQKQQFFEFLDAVLPRGDTKPQRAIRRALLLEPDLIYLLSDGIDFEPELLTALEQWNRERRTRIFTIAYLDQTGSELLEQIARAHNGEFRFVSENDLP